MVQWTRIMEMILKNVEQREDIFVEQSDAEKVR